MSDQNHVFLIGRLTQKPIIKYSASGTPICTMSIANSVYQGKGKEDKTNFFNITIFGARAESCSKYLDKGKQIAAYGRLDHQTWTTNEGDKRSTVKIVAQSIQFIGSKPKQEGEVNSDSDNEQYGQPTGPTKKDTSPDLPNNDMNPGPQDKFESPIEDTDDIPF
ncbi:MAG: single-stranded DNA-binding protein [Candidatus Nanoarchaeia archaeon]|nr:single-stranded DNA-binding protein [Candidatus Nanoarchaeia archaeon]